MIIVRSERRLPPTKGISDSEPEYRDPRMAQRVIQVRVVLGYVSVEPWDDDPTRRHGVFPLHSPIVVIVIRLR